MKLLSMRILLVLVTMVFSSQSFARAEPCAKPYNNYIHKIGLEIRNVETKLRVLGVATTEDRQNVIDRLSSEKNRLEILLHDVKMARAWVGYAGFLNEPGIYYQEYRYKMMEELKHDPRTSRNSYHHFYLYRLTADFSKSGKACANNRLMSAAEMKEKIIQLIMENPCPNNRPTTCFEP